MLSPIAFAATLSPTLIFMRYVSAATRRAPRIQKVAEVVTAMAQR